MFESTRDLEGPGTGRRSAWISTAAFVHAGILLAVVVASLLARVEAGADPPEPMPPVDPRSDLDVKLGDSPDAGAGPAKLHETPKPHKATEPEAQEKSDLQPVTVPERVPAPPLEANPLTQDREDVVANKDRGDEGIGDPDGTGFGPPGVVGEPWGRKTGTEIAGPPLRPGPVPPETNDPSTYGIEQPVLLTRIEPEYPPIDIQARLEGNVVLEALIGASGRVESIRVLFATNPRMQASAVRAVERWRYRPARQNGRAIGVFVTIHVHFELK